MKLNHLGLFMVFVHVVIQTKLLYHNSVYVLFFSTIEVKSMIRSGLSASWTPYYQNFPVMVQSEPNYDAYENFPDRPRVI